MPGERLGGSNLQDGLEGVETVGLLIPHRPLPDCLPACLSACRCGLSHKLEDEDVVQVCAKHNP